MENYLKDQTGMKIIFEEVNINFFQKTKIKQKQLIF